MTREEFAERYKVEGAKSISPNYVYACELIQWVENNLEDWCKERNINYEECLN